MKHSPSSRLCVLAVDPASRGLGFTLLEGPDNLIDWGFRNARGARDAQTVAYLESLLSVYKPDVLVLEAFDPAKKAHRSPRVRNLLNVFATLAAKNGVPCERIPREAVRALFSCRNKYRIARKLAARFPELKPSCPPQRKIWLPEDPRINIFDALALGCAYFAVEAEREGKQTAA